jgi:hypothetical protein
MGNRYRKRSKTATGTMFPLKPGKSSNGVCIRVDEKGYLRIWSGFFRRQRLHRLVASAVLGRELRKDEDVHHKNEIKLDCDPDNLEVKGKAEHGWESARQHFWVGKIMEEREREQWEDYFTA